MLYQVIFESEDDIINVTWDGGQFIELYAGVEELPDTTIDIWNYAVNKPCIAVSASALAAYMMGWMGTNRPTFGFETVAGHTIQSFSLQVRDDGDLESI